MAKFNFKPNTQIHQIFDDLDEYRSFCVSHGRVFNEAALYNERDRDYHDFLKFKERGYTRNNWNWINKDPNEQRRPFNKDHRGPRGHNNYRQGHNRNA